MNVINNKTGVPLTHYRELLKNSDVDLLSARSGIEYSGDAFRTVLLGRCVNITREGGIFFENGDIPCEYTQILLIRLILEGVLLPFSGGFKAYKELPWGGVYEQQFNARCVKRLAAVYGKKLQLFREACESLGGIEISAGDAGSELEFLPGLKMRLMLWEPDEEFPASAQILFSDNFASAFTAEDMAVAGDTLINAMKGRW